MNFLLFVNFAMSHSKGHFNYYILNFYESFIMENLKERQ